MIGPIVLTGIATNATKNKKCNSGQTQQHSTLVNIFLRKGVTCFGVTKLYKA